LITSVKKLTNVAIVIAVGVPFYKKIGQGFPLYVIKGNNKITGRKRYTILKNNNGSFLITSGGCELF
jgi:hypothetical protein